MRVSTLLATRRGRVGLSVVAALAVSGGIAYASIPDGSGTIYACSLNNVGTIRLIDPSKPGLKGHCSNIETQVSWNQKGQPGAAGAKGDKGDPGAPGAKGDKGDPGAPGAAGAKGDKGDPGAPGAAGAKGDKGDPGAPGAAGAKGDKGDPGAPGAKGDPGAPGAKGDPGAPGAAGAKGDKGDPGTPGVSGYQVVSASTDIVSGSEVTGLLPCPAGKKATGGGWTTADNRFDVNVVGSGPNADGTAWTGGMYNSGTTTARLTLTVLCVTAPDSASLAASERKSSAPVFTVVKAGD